MKKQVSRLQSLHTSQIVDIASSAMTIGAFFIVAGPHVFCAFGNIPPYLSAFFLPLLAFESLLGGLAIYKWVKEVGVTLASPRLAPALLRVLVRDSVIYFIVYVELP